MSSRERLFAKISTAVAGQPERSGLADVKARMASHRVNLMPGRADKPEPERFALFQQKCAELGVTIDVLPDANAVPAAVAAWLKQHNLPPRLRLAPDATVTGLDWSTVPLLETDTGAAVIEDQVSLTPAFAGIAETGTLMLQSSPDTPVTLNFVPDNHMVMLRRSQVMRAMEDAFGALRAGHGEGIMPRTVNLISGASRTGDVEQKIILGAHGPRRLHIMLIDDLD